MNRKLKLAITLLVALVLLALFFWATTKISVLTGHSITGSSVDSSGIGSPSSGDNSDSGTNNLNDIRGGSQDELQDKG